MVRKLNKCRKGRFMKLNKQSDGYKRGLRYIDFGETKSSKIKFLKKKPIC